MLPVTRLFRRTQGPQLHRLALPGDDNHRHASTPSVAKQLLAKADQPPAPAARARTVVPRGGSEHLRPLRALFPGTAAAEPDDHEEYERTAERHEEDLPPLEGRTAAGLRGRGDARDGGEGRGGVGSRRLRDDDQLGQAGPKTGDDVGGALAVCGHARATAENLAGAGAREAVAGASTGTARAARVAGLTGRGGRVEVLGFAASGETAAVQ